MLMDLCVLKLGQANRLSNFEKYCLSFVFNVLNISQFPEQNEQFNLKPF